VLKLFRKFVNVKNEACHIGVMHLLFIMGMSVENPIYKFVTAIETALERLFGFYWIVTFQKPE